MANNKAVTVDGGTTTVQNKMTDDAYLESIAQYSDKPYYQYLLNNPWMYSKQGDFAPNFWQQLGEDWFNDYSARNNYYSSILSNQNQWLSESLERFRQEEYNSPSSQVARQRAAGLNPDLNGSVDSGSAAENDQPILGNPQFPEGNSLKIASNFFMQLIPLASGFAKDMMSLQNLSNDVQSGNIDLAEKISRAAFDFMSSHVNLNKVKDSERGDYWQIADLSLDALDKYSKEMFSSRSARNKFKKQVQSTWSSSAAKFKQYSSIKNAEDARRAMAESFGFTEGYYGVDAVDSIDPIVTVTHGLSEMQNDIDRLQKNYTSDYFHNIDGGLAARAENETNKGVIEQQNALSYQRKLDEIVNKSMQQIVDSLEKNSHGNSWEAYFSKAILLLVSAMRTGMMPSLPSVSLRGLIENKNYNTYKTTNNDL